MNFEVNIYNIKLLSEQLSPNTNIDWWLSICLHTGVSGGIWKIQWPRVSPAICVEPSLSPAICVELSLSSVSCVEPQMSPASCVEPILSPASCVEFSLSPAI